MKNAWTVIGLIVVVLIGGSIVYSNSVSKSYDEGVDITIEHIKGNPEASVTLTEFSDFQCPACASWQPVLSDLMEQYGDEIRFEYKNFPLPIHNLARSAAYAAEAAGQQGMFFEYHDMLFENQSNWSNNPNSKADFINYAEQLGLDVEMFEKHMKSSLIKEKVDSNLAEGRSLNVNATPTLFLNGEKMTVTTFEDFYSQIELALNPQVEFNLPETPSSEIE